MSLNSELVNEHYIKSVSSEDYFISLLKDAGKMEKEAFDKLNS